MKDSKYSASSLLAAAAIAMADAVPVPSEYEPFPKPWTGPKGRSNDKVGKSIRGRAKKKAAHKARMAQKGK